MSPDPLFRLLRAAGRALGRLAVGLLALLILFEEWGWEPLRRVLIWLGRLPAMRRIEAVASRLPPYPALAVLLLPTLGLLPVKLLALWLIASGKAPVGLAVVVAAKVVGTAVLAWLFSLTHPALMRIPWFATGYGRWYAWKEALLARVRASWAWRTGRAVKRLMRRWFQWQRA
jgi:hypothetical protein